MKLRWTPRAVADLEEISDYLVAATPQAWEHLLQRLERLTEAILDFPLMGKAGLVPGTREFVLSGFGGVSLSICGAYTFSCRQGKQLVLLCLRLRNGTSSVASLAPATDST